MILLTHWKFKETPFSRASFLTEGRIDDLPTAGVGEQVVQVDNLLVVGGGVVEAFLCPSRSVEAEEASGGDVTGVVCFETVDVSGPRHFFYNLHSEKKKEFSYL